MYRVLIRVDCICFCIVQYCKGMPITSSALGAMPPSSIQTFVNYSYCIDHLLKEINVTLNLNLNPSISFAPGRTGDWRRSLTACHNADTVAHTIAASASCCAVHASEALYSVSQERHCHYFLYVLLPLLARCKTLIVMEGWELLQYYLVTPKLLSKSCPVGHDSMKERKKSSK